MSQASAEGVGGFDAPCAKCGFRDFQFLAPKHMALHKQIAPGRFSCRLPSLNYLSSEVFTAESIPDTGGSINIPGIVFGQASVKELNPASLAQARGACVSLTTV